MTFKSLRAFAGSASSFFEIRTSGHVCRRGGYFILKLTYLPVETRLYINMNGYLKIFINGKLGDSQFLSHIKDAEKIQKKIGKIKSTYRGQPC